MRRYSYILLVCTWVFIAVSVVYFWLRHGLEPPVALWVALVIVALIPLAERLKIGNWFDFTRKIENLGKEISTTQKEVHEVSNRLNAFMANVQSQQQFNIGLYDKEAARVLAEYISSGHKGSYPPSLEEITSRGEDKFFSEKMSPTDRQRFFFVSAVDEALASVTPLIRTLYAAVIAVRGKKLANVESVYRKTIISLLEELPDYIKELSTVAGGEPDNVISDKLQQYSREIRTVIELRENVRKGSSEPPSVQEGQKIIGKVKEAEAYLEGVISTLVSVLFVPEMRGRRIPRDSKE